MDGVGVSIGLVALVSAALVGSGLRKQPGLGILAALAVIGLVLWSRGDGLAAIGFAAPTAWWPTVAWALAFGVALQLLAIAVVDPLVERATGVPQDHSVVAGVKGSPRAFALWMVLVWLVAAPLEEAIFRGFLMTEIARVGGTTPMATLLNVALSSAVFGLAHAYQGRSGVLSTGVVGAFLGWIFVASDYGLWLAILTHGFVDTVGIALVAVGADEVLRRRFRGAAP